MAAKMEKMSKKKAGATLWQRVMDYLWSAKDPSSLAVTRFFFGLLMVVDIPIERGFSEIDLRWGDPNVCHFPLFDFLKPLPFHWMCIVYFIMWIGALGIAIGYKFKLSCLCFLIPYWYIFLLDKTSWNNHSYLYGLLSILLLTSSANHYWSVDSWIDASIRNRAVPFWNYLIIRFQIFLLYFYAGLKKTDIEWLSGYSARKLANHWVFEPFKILLSNDQIDYFIVHLGGFILDLTIGFWLLWSKSRPYAMFFGAAFHLMNSRIFSIGMFPYMCLATLPVFCEVDWPKKVISKAPAVFYRFLPKVCISRKFDYGHQQSKQKVIFMIVYILIQLLLPWSHGITQGYNNWTYGLYGYSWDMMVHGWQTMHVAVSVKHKPTGKVNYLDTEVFAKNDKWVGHTDMIYQYAHCVQDRLRTINMTDVSIYVDVWRSLNGRFQQRFVDPRVDILAAEWSPFKPTKWFMPLLIELTPWRQKLDHLEQNILSWSQSSNVLFVADFPGLSMENYLPSDVTNATLHVLEGEVDLLVSHAPPLRLTVNETAPLPTDILHTVKTISDKPACYMYTYFGIPKSTTKIDNHIDVWQDIVTSFTRPFYFVSRSLLHLLFGVPLVSFSTK